MEELAAIAEANGGYLMRRQLNELGITDDGIRARLRAGVLERIRHGTYVVKVVWSILDDTQRHVVRSRAVLDRLGGTVVATHQTACALHGFDLWGFDLRNVHVTRLDGRQGRREAGVVYHQGSVDSEELVEIDGRLTVDPVRSAIEAATSSSIEGGMVVLSSMMRVTGESKAQVSDRLRSFRHWPGVRRADVALRLSDGRLETVGEVRSMFMFWRFRMPVPDLQREIVDDDGRIVARLDFYWDAHRHAGEFDGLVKYGRLNPYSEKDVGRVLTDEKAREDAVRRRELGMSRWTWPELGSSVQSRTTSRIRVEMERSRRLYARSRVHIA